MQATRRRAILFSVALALAACGRAKPAKTAKVESGPMPADAEWSGVYYSPAFGTLHLVQEGNLVNGRWQRPTKGKWGELQGNANGNLLRFDWKEYTTGLVGPNSTKSGKGYFQYSRPSGDNVDDLIAGQVGRDEDEVGTPWDAVKQRNVKPDLDAIGGTGATDVGGGDWDKGNTEGGEPEPPVEPKPDAPDI
jgi:hypothetical protein